MHFFVFMASADDWHRFIAAIWLFDMAWVGAPGLTGEFDMLSVCGVLELLPAWLAAVICANAGTATAVSAIAAIVNIFRITSLQSVAS